MAVVSHENALILNLVSIFRDLGITPAECKNEIELGALSSEDRDFSKERRSKLYDLGDTSCDGFLLLYHFDTPSMREDFISDLKKLGFESGTHMAGDNCIWLKEITVELSSNGEVSGFFNCYSHVDDVSGDVCLSARERESLKSYTVVDVTASWVEISKEFIEYRDVGVFWKIATGVLSLFKTRFKHTEYFKPYEYTLKSKKMDSLQFTEQVLPGITSVVPMQEVARARKLESEPLFLKMFHPDGA